MKLRPNFYLPVSSAVALASEIAGDADRKSVAVRSDFASGHIAADCRSILTVLRSGITLFTHELRITHRAT